MSEEETHDLEKLGTEWAVAAASDLSGLFGIDVSLSGPSVLQTERATLFPKSGAVVCSRCEVAEEEGSPFWIVLPLRGALVFAAAKKEKSPAEFSAFESSPFEGAVSEAYAGTMDICAGILGRVLDEEAGLPALQLRESSPLDLPLNNDAIPDGIYRCARFEFEVAGFPKQQLDILFGKDLATKWFGQMEDSVATGSTESLELKIAIVDPSEESREEFAQIAEQLDAQVVDLDPAKMGPEWSEVLEELSWVVLTWDLGGRSGLELIDELRGDEATSHLKFAIASPAPTRAMTEAALRWGAHTVLYQPWEADEIRERLGEPV